MVVNSIHIPSAEVEEFCRRHGVLRLSLFGSVLQPSFDASSDIDVLVEFPNGETPSLLALGGMLMELRRLLGRDVDLKTPGFLADPIRERVMREARVLYAA